MGGFVGFLPFSVANPDSVRRLGVLQRFYVASLTEAKRSFVLMDPGAYRAGHRDPRGHDGERGKGRVRQDRGPRPRTRP